MFVVGLIPARCGSKSIPWKNILPLGGHPLIAYSVAASELAETIDQTVVSTDCREIADVAGAYGARVPFLRPAALSGDQSLDLEFFQHYLAWCAEAGEPVPDLIVHLRPTTPLRDVRVIDQAVRWMMDHPEATSLRSAHISHHTPYKLFRNEDGYAVPFVQYEGEYPGKPEFYNLPRQYFPDAWLGNGYVDVVRSSVVIESGVLHGPRLKLFATEQVPDIDVGADVEYAKAVLGLPEFRPLLDHCEALHPGGAA